MNDKTSKIPFIDHNDIQSHNQFIEDEWNETFHIIKKKTLLITFIDALIFTFLISGIVLIVSFSNYTNINLDKIEESIEFLIGALLIVFCFIFLIFNIVIKSTLLVLVLDLNKNYKPKLNRFNMHLSLLLVSMIIFFVALADSFFLMKDCEQFFKSLKRK